MKVMLLQERRTKDGSRRQRSRLRCVLRLQKEDSVCRKGQQVLLCDVSLGIESVELIVDHIVAS